MNKATLTAIYHPELVAALLKQLSTRGELYLVCGSVRDLLLSRKSKDIDLAVAAEHGFRHTAVMHSKISWLRN